MTDFAALLIADDGAGATPLMLVSTADFDIWMRDQGERTRSLVAAQKFKGGAGEVAVLPGDGRTPSGGGIKGGLGGGEQRRIGWADGQLTADGAGCF